MPEPAADGATRWTTAADSPHIASDIPVHSRYDESTAPASCAARARHCVSPSIERSIRNATAFVLTPRSNRRKSSCSAWNSSRWRATKRANAVCGRAGLSGTMSAAEPALPPSLSSATDGGKMGA